MINKPLRWGILGTGNIARQFCAGVSAGRRSVLAAVGSRSLDMATAFAAEYGVGRAFGSYDEVLADPTVEAAYISLPNALHHAWTIKALQAGKHVLCEKPMAVNVQQAQEMFDIARASGLVLVEAFMYRSHPLMHAVRLAVLRGEIGALRLIRTSFCYRTKKIAGNIRFDPDLAGGALMDVGCYCVDFSKLFAGEDPVAFTCSGRRHESGVDDVAAGTMFFPSGCIASFTCGMSVQAYNGAFLCGDEGYIEVPVPWKPPVKGAEYHIVRATPPRQDAADANFPKGIPNAGPRRTFTVHAAVELYGLEADDFAATVQGGKAPAVSEAETLSTIKIIEGMRRQIER